MHCNCQGLLNSYSKATSTSGYHYKLDYLKHLLNFTNSPNIFCITETKLSARVPNSEITIANYKTFRCDRNRKGGGVLLYCLNLSIQN